jgi:phosphoribosylglycinamide formyltransferase-1
MKKVAFLVSGGGGTLKYFYHYTKLFPEEINIVAVIGDRECEAIDFARKNFISNYIVKYSKEKHEELNLLFSSLTSDIVVTNIHKILDKTTLNACRAEFINLHYSILPSFKGFIGMKTVDEAKKNNCKFIGVTTHFVNEELDEGKIIFQATFNPDWDSTDMDIIYDIVFQIGCIALLSTVLSLLGENNTKGNRHEKSLIILGKQVFFSDYLPISLELHNSIYSLLN